MFRLDKAILTPVTEPGFSVRRFMRNARSEYHNARHYPDRSEQLRRHRHYCVKCMLLQQRSLVRRRGSSAGDWHDGYAMSSLLKLIQHVDYKSKFMQISFRLRVRRVHHPHRGTSRLQRMGDCWIEARALMQVRLPVASEYHIRSSKRVHSSLLFNAYQTMLLNIFDLLLGYSSIEHA